MLARFFCGDHGARNGSSARLRAAICLQVLDHFGVVHHPVLSHYPRRNSFWASAGGQNEKMGFVTEPKGLPEWRS